MAHILPTSANETINEGIVDYCLVFYSVFARSAQSAETLQTLYSTQTRGDDLSFTSMIDLLLSFFAFYGWK